MGSYQASLLAQLKKFHGINPYIETMKQTQLYYTKTAKHLMSYD